ncbi:AAA family ATPase [Fusobacterium mortiferum]|uniref:AAA family ATPase n=1 Tax=Fusobacterium mortiferum TaxID=850 RepID=UPI000E44941D|nr:AAA family ATPase [Fusobacterium mortiferum]RGN00745.1 hypothetical protein DXB84_02370 [Fusobacterium mortiferum]
MQLIYFWDGNEKGINFNSNFHFEIENRCLKRIKNKEKKLPQNFFGKDIENINCFIGKNGAGKTLLVKSILGVYRHFLKEKNIIILKKFISVFEENNELYVLRGTKNIKIELENFILIDEEKDFKKYFDLKYIYYTTNLSTTFPLSINTNIINLSLREQLNKFLEKKSNKLFLDTDPENFFEKYYQNIFQDILNFIINEEILIESIPDKSFKEKLISIKEKGEICCILNIESFSTENKFLEKIVSFSNSETLKKDMIIFKIIWEYLSRWLFSNIKQKIIKEEIILELVERPLKRELKNWIVEMINILISKINSYKIKKRAVLDIQVLEIIKEILTYKNVYFYEKEMTFRYSENKELLKKIYTLPQLDYQEDLFKIGFKERFSSGELEFLNLIIALKRCGANVHEKNIIFFLEELEAFMHPEWQRKIIDFLSNLKDSLPWLQNKKIQIILTSHTPFIVGDLPETNIIFLENKKVVENSAKTFGSNIYDLFKDNFLLESCFGEFSRKKIKKVIDLLDKENGKYNIEEIEKNIIEIEFIIDSIGEPLIKNRLDKMYNDYKEFKNIENSKDNNEEIDFKKYIKENNLNLSEVMKILEERKNDKTI